MVSARYTPLPPVSSWERSALGPGGSFAAGVVPAREEVDAELLEQAASATATRHVAAIAEPMRATTDLPSDVPVDLFT
jgi:hypothetical protein